MSKMIEIGVLLENRVHLFSRNPWSVPSMDPMEATTETNLVFDSGIYLSGMCPP